MRHHSHGRPGHAFTRHHGFGDHVPAYPHHEPPHRPGFPPAPGPIPGLPFAAGGPWPGALSPMAGFLGRGGRRGGRRQRRGNVRAAVLALLAERPMHGYEMIQELAQRTHGLWKPSPGSVYPTLQLLTDEGLITAAEQGGKRLFTLTESGNAEVANQASSTPWAEVAGDVDQDAMQLHTALSQLFMAVDQISQAGTEEQKTKAVKAINDAKRRIYELLAQDDEVDDVDEED